MGTEPREIAAGVYWVPIGVANVYLVRSGPLWVLIDTSWSKRAALIREAAESVFGADARPACILITHLHPDHTASAVELARLWNVPVYVHEAELPLAAKNFPPEYLSPFERRLVEPLVRLLPRRPDNSELAAVLRALDPSSAVPGLPDWTCIHTPGHTPGHIVLFRGSDRVLITGDAILTINVNSLWDLLLGKQLVSGPPYISTWNWPAAKASVAALAALEPNVLACGHGIPMSGPAVARDLHALADRYARSTTMTSSRSADIG